MKQQISAFLIDSDAASTSQMAETLKAISGDVRLIGTAGELREGMKLIHASGPDVVILEVKELERGAREVEYLLHASPQSSVFVSCGEKSPTWILGLIRAGATEYLTRPVSPPELAAAVQKVARARAAKNRPAGKRGETISVYNPCGGVGTTTVAVNLAATLAAQGHSTALVDLNLFSGDLSAFLDLSPRYTLASVMPKAGEVDASLLTSIMVPHASGVQVLDGPADLGEASRITPELLKEVISVLRLIYDYTVIDTGGQLFGCNLATFDQSDQILFTTVLSVPGLRNAKRYLSALSGEGFGPGRVKVVVNRHVPRDEIRIADAEKVLGVKSYHALPNSYTDVRASINKGVPLVLHLPKSPFSRSMELMGRELTLEGQKGAVKGAQEVGGNGIFR